MRVLIVGSGGREHALAWTIAASPLVEQVSCAPGNAGIAEEANACRSAASDIAGAGRFLPPRNAVDFVVVGPEAPLVAAWSTRSRRPASRRSARPRRRRALEGSKAFTKDLCAREGIPTAAYRRASRCRGGQGLYRGDGRADRRQGRRARRRQGGRRRRHRRGGAGRGRCDAGRARSAPPAPRSSSRSASIGEEASFFALCDGDDRAAVGGGAGPQARRRRRHRPQHRRHGRLFAGAASSTPRWSRRGHGRISGRRCAAMAARGRAVQGRPLCRADADRGRAEAAGVQRPFRRPGMPGADDAADERPAAGADRGAWTGCCACRPALARRRPRSAS